MAPDGIGRDAADIAALMGELRRRLQVSGVTARSASRSRGSTSRSGTSRARSRASRSTAAWQRRRAAIDVPAYASLLRYGAAAWSSAMPPRRRRAAIAGSNCTRSPAETVAAATGRPGAGCPLMVDINCAWDFAGALTMARQFTPHDLWWLEEPIATAQRFRRARPPAPGSRHADRRRREFRQPRRSAVHAGQGGGRHHPAERHQDRRHQRDGEGDRAGARPGVTVAPHSPYFGPGLIATVHVIAAVGEDMFASGSTAISPRVPLGEPSMRRGGRMAVPQGPGLGITSTSG